MFQSKREATTDCRRGAANSRALSRPPASTADRTSVGLGHYCFKWRFYTRSVRLERAA